LDLQSFDEVLVNQRSQELCDRALDTLVYDLSDAKFEEYKNAITKNLQPTLDSWANEDRIVDCLLGSDSQFYYSSIFN
jgi:hypothetical protein